MPHPLYALPRERERQQLTVDVLAKQAGITAPTLRRLERGGQPSYITWRSLAAALGVEPWDLVHVGTRAECAECQARYEPSWAISSR